MSRQFQYQEFTEPVIGAEPKAFVTPGANQPWSNPIQLFTKTISTALIASGLFAPPPTGFCAFFQGAFSQLSFATCFTPNLGEYYIPLSEPVRVAVRSVDFAPGPSGEAFVPIVQQDLVTSWYVPLSEPVRVKPIDAWFQEYTKGTQPAVSFSYYQPLVDPVRVPPRDVWFQPDTLTRTASDVTGIRYLPLSEPVRVPQRDAWFQPVVVEEIQPVVSFSYFNWLSEPVRAALRSPDFPATVLGRPASDVTGIQYPPLSEPVRAAARPPQYQDETFQFVATAGAPADSWLPVFPDSVPTAARAAWYQDAAFYPFPFPNAAFPPDTWLPVFPHSAPAAARAAWYQDLALYPLPFPNPPPTVPSGSWSQPTQTVTLQYQGVALGRPASDVTGIQYLPLSEPVRTPPRDAWYQPDTLGRQASDVTGIRYLALAEPVRTALRDAWYQDATSFNPFPLPPATVFVSGWGAVFPDFARPAPRVAYNQELAFVVGGVVPPPAANTLMSWEPWADPPPPLPIIALREGWPTYIDAVDNAQPDTGHVWRRYWIQDDPNHILNRDAPHDLVWADEDDVITVLLL